MADIVSMPLGADARERLELLTRLHLLGRKNGFWQRLSAIVAEMLSPLRDGKKTGKSIDSDGAYAYKLRS